MIEGECSFHPIWQLNLFTKRVGQDPILDTTHQLVCLLGQAEGQDLEIALAYLYQSFWVNNTYCVGQNTGQVRKEALVDGKHSLLANGLEQAVEHTLV